MTTGEYEEIERVVRLYVEGANGDVAKLQDAFHSDARMFGHIGTMETYVPITDFFDMVARHPGMAGPEYTAEITSIHVVGDAAVAALTEHDFLGCDFVDFFSLARIGGEWKIVNKTYAHTGGSLPVA